MPWITHDARNATNTYGKFPHSVSMPSTTFRTPASYLEMQYEMRCKYTMHVLGIGAGSVVTPWSASTDASLPLASSDAKIPSMSCMPWVSDTDADSAIRSWWELLDASLPSNTLRTGCAKCNVYVCRCPFGCPHHVPTLPFTRNSHVTSIRSFLCSF